MPIIKRSAKYATPLIILTASFSTYAQSPWYFTAAGTTTSGKYQQQDNKRTFNKFGVYIQADYFEKISAAVAVNQTTYYYRQTPVRWKQTQYAGSIQHTSFNDYLKGKLIKKIILLNISDDFSDWSSVAASLNYLNFDNTLLIGLGLTSSNFDNSDSKLSSTQLTPQLGKSIWQNKLWLNLKADFISAGSRHYETIQPSLTLYTGSPRRWLIPYSLTLGAKWGENRYHFDSDNFLAYNTDDKQTGAYFGTIGWNVFDKAFLYLSIGQENFKTTSDSTYSLRYLLMNISKTW